MLTEIENQTGSSIPGAGSLGGDDVAASKMSKAKGLGAPSLAASGRPALPGQGKGTYGWAANARAGSEAKAAASKGEASRL